jgi:hypothetical protein
MDSLAPQVEFEAEYQLESAVKCSECKQMFETVKVVRLLRKKVNFTSSLPRRGCVIVCPNCHTVVPAVLGTRGGL